MNSEARPVGDDRHHDRAKGDGADHVSDLLPGYALGALDAGERVRVERHLAGCPVCRREVADAQRVVGALAFAAPPAVPGADVKLALFTRIAHADQPLAEAMAPRAARRQGPALPSTLTLPASRPMPAAASATPNVGPPRTGVPRWANLASAILTVPLLVALAATGAWAMQLRGEVDEGRDRANSYGAVIERTLEDDAARLVLRPYRNAPDAKGVIATNAERNSVAFLMRYPAGAGQTYQLVTKEDKVETVLAQVELDERGNGADEVFLKDSLNDYRLVRVKLKSSLPGAVESPESDQVLWGYVEDFRDAAVVAPRTAEDPVAVPES